MKPKKTKANTAIKITASKTILLAWNLICLPAIAGFLFMMIKHHGHHCLAGLISVLLAYLIVFIPLLGIYLKIGDGFLEHRDIFCNIMTIKTSDIESLWPGSGRGSVWVVIPKKKAKQDPFWINPMFFNSGDKQRIMEQLPVKERRKQVL